MAVGTFSSRILGFVRDAVMFAIFPRSVTDAFAVAFRLPNVFRRVLGEGALSASFIPIYVETRRRSEAEAQQLANATFSIVFAVSTFISVVCFVFMDDLLLWWVGDPRGFASIPGKLEQTVYMARIMIFYLMLVSTYAFHMAIANTLGHYFLPAVGPTLFNFGLILFTVLPYEMGPYAGSSQSWGVIFGGILQSAVVIWLLIKVKALPKFTWRWRSPGVLNVFANTLPGMLGLGIFQVMTIANAKFAARLSEGSQSYLYLGDRVLELPQSLIAVSLGAALLPRFSELHSAGKRDSFLEEANRAVRMLLYLSLPAAVGMGVMAVPITQVLFQRGEFTQADAVGTAQLVEIYSCLLIFSSLSRVTAPAFYALKNTWLPACVALFVLLVHISIAPYMVDYYGLPGLAASTAASSILNVVILQVFFHHRIGSLGYGRIFASCVRLLPAMTAMGTFCWWAFPLATNMFMGTLGLSEARILALTMVIVGAMIIYFYISVLFKSSEATQVVQALRRRRASSNS